MFFDYNNGVVLYVTTTRTSDVRGNINKPLREKDKR